MKKYLKKSKIVAYIMFAIMLICSFMLSGCKKEKPVKEQEVANAELDSDTELIFSFESYEDITGARLRVHNLLGKTAVNHDKQYITDGEGSWMIQPHGSWAEDSYPSFDIHCNGGFFPTTVLTGDFFDFDKVLLDIYNSSDEEAEIRWQFSAMNTHGSYSTNGIEPVVCTLAPNAWTTCEYDLTDEIYNYFYHLEDVSAMTVEFLSKKESKDDVVQTLYLDNLRGHISETERSFEDACVDITELLTFESVMEGYTVHGYTANGVTNLQRVAYSDTTISGKDSSFGEYCMFGTATGARYLCFEVPYYETVKAGMVLTAWIYVEADPGTVEGLKYRMESYNSIEDRVVNTPLNQDFEFNQWHKVAFKLGVDAKKAYVYANLDGLNIPHFEDFATNLYIDNIQVVPGEAEVKKNADGSYTITNPNGIPSVTNKFDCVAKAGQSIAFDVDMDPAIYSAIYIFGSNGENIYETGLWPGWSGHQSIVTSPLKNDIEWFSVRLEYRDTAYDPAKVVTKFSNIHAGKYGLSNGITFESPVDMGFIGGANSPERVAYADTKIEPLDSTAGKYVYKYDGTGDRWPDFNLRFDKKYPKGTIVSFLMYVEADSEVTSGKTFAVESRLSRDGGTGNTVLQGRSYPFNTWVQVDVQLGSECNKLYAYANMDSSVYQYDVDTPTILGDATVNIYIDNFSVAEYTVGAEKNSDASVTFTNPLGLAELSYAFDISAKAGQSLVFDVDMEPAIYSAVYVFDADGTALYETGLWPGWSGERTIIAPLNRDIKGFRVKLEYRDSAYAARYDKITTTISNVHAGYYGLSHGITFESAVDMGFVGNANSPERVAYADTTIKPLNSTAGKYVYKYDGTEDRWPDFDLRFDKKYPEGTIVSFLMYIEANPEVTSGKTFAVESRLSRDGGTGNTVLQGRNYPFNKWVQVDVQLGSECDKLYAYANMDSSIYQYDVDTPTILGDATVNIYIDNFSVAEYTVGAEKNPDGSVIFTNPLGLAALNYTFDVAGEEGKTLALDIEMNPAIYSAIYVYSSNGANLYENGLWPGWSGKTKINILLKEDIEWFRIRLEYRDEAYSARFGEVVTTINAEVTDVQEFEFTAATNHPTIYNKELKAGQTISFHVQTEKTAPIVVWVQGVYQNGDKLTYVELCNPIVRKTLSEGETITVTCPRDIKYLRLQVQTRVSPYGAASTSWSAGTLKVSNIQVSSEE